MNKEDRLGLELKSIMDEDTKDKNLSPVTIEEILNHRKRGIKRKKIIRIF